MKNISIPRSTPVGSTRRSSEETDSCPHCKGAGFVRIDAPVDSPNFSRLIPCVCKQDERWARSDRDKRRYSNLDLIEGWEFATFDPGVAGTHDAHAIARAYADDPHDWLVFVGPYGCGKTHLAAAIANYARRELSMSPIFAVVPDLLDYLRSTFAPDSDTTYESRFDAVRSTDLLILDDLGTENTTPWAREKLFQIVNHRYMERLPTVFTTNVDLDALDGRVRSRICDRDLSTLIFFDADDYRMRGVLTPRRRARR
jgi:DNA replication protein DnaC